uniref:60S ribosomal protein L21 n=1 Tax=Sarcophilus harrisii TaxID=9305 RepID=A0A7N4NFL9_SARHA
MRNAKGKSRRTQYMYSGPFRKHGVVFFPTYMGIYEKGDIVDVKVVGTVQQGTPYKCYHGKAERVYNVTLHTIGIVVNNQCFQS